MPGTLTDFRVGLWHFNPGLTLTLDLLLQTESTRSLLDHYKRLVIVKLLGLVDCLWLWSLFKPFYFRLRYVRRRHQIFWALNTVVNGVLRTRLRLISVSALPTGQTPFFGDLMLPFKGIASQIVLCHLDFSCIVDFSSFHGVSSEWKVMAESLRIWQVLWAKLFFPMEGLKVLTASAGQLGPGVSQRDGQIGTFVVTQSLSFACEAAGVVRGFEAGNG